MVFTNSLSSYYEKFLATGEVKCIDEEIPFEIPQSWCWTRMGAIGDWGSGSTPQRGNTSYYGGDILWLKTGELNNGVVYDTSEKITSKALRECSLRLNKVGDVLIAMYGATIGKVAIAGKEMTTNQACCGCTPILVYNYYLFYYLMASRIDFIKKGEGGAQPNISRDKLINHLIPLPPIAEQHRIVDGINLVLPYIDKYEKSQEALDKLNAEIFDKLKKSVLQEAIQGKLVPQDSNDEPVSVLLERIKEEKAKLFKEGKLKKKDLVNSVIFKGEDNKYYEKIGKEVICIDEEIPFDIPESWTWVRIKDMFIINPKNTASDDTLAAFIPMEKISATYGSVFTYDTVRWGTIKRSFTHIANGDVAFAKITPCFQNRKSAIFEGLPNDIGAATTELKVLRQYGDTINRWYLLYFLESPYFIDEAKFKGTANQQRIISGYLENKLFPLPPKSEQDRIAYAIEQTASIMSRQEKRSST